jgi:hypothetical protein
MKVLRCFAPTLLFFGLSTTTVFAGEFLPVANPIFARVPVECLRGYAYQGLSGATCTSQSFPAQDFNGTPGMGWVLTPDAGSNGSAGVTGPGTAFQPPSFSGLPFSTAALLQGQGSTVSQTIFQFVADQPYRLAFYRGSRQANGSSDGNQTVALYVDDRLIEAWGLASYAPFTLRYASVTVAHSGPHIVSFVGTASGDHTAFLSGVIIEAVEAADEK